MDSLHTYIITQPGINQSKSTTCQSFSRNKITITFGNAQSQLSGVPRKWVWLPNCCPHTFTSIENPASRVITHLCVECLAPSGPHPLVHCKKVIWNEHDKSIRNRSYICMYVGFYDACTMFNTSKSPTLILTGLFYFLWSIKRKGKSLWKYQCNYRPQAFIPVCFSFFSGIPDDGHQP